MAGRNLRVVFAEINDAIAGIEQAIEGRGVEDFGHDWLLKHGVERGLEIISEAARHIPDRYTAHEPDIPWKQIRGIGNILRHEYHKIADGIVWAVAIDYLPPLRQAIARMEAAIRSEKQGTPDFPKDRA